MTRRRRWRRTWSTGWPANRLRRTRRRAGAVVALVPPKPGAGPGERDSGGGIVVAAVVSTVFAVHQTDHARRLAQDANDLREEQKQTYAQKVRAETALVDVNAQRVRADERTQLAERRLAENYLNRGLGLCEQGDAGRGLLLLAKASRAQPVEEKTLASATRANLAEWRQRVAGVKAILEHRDAVNSVAFSPDGKYVLTGSMETAQVWETTSGQPVGKALDHRGAVVSVAFSPDGKYVLTGSRDNTSRSGRQPRATRSARR